MGSVDTEEDRDDRSLGLTSLLCFNEKDDFVDLLEGRFNMVLFWVLGCLVGFIERWNEEKEEVFRASIAHTQRERERERNERNKKFSENAYWDLCENFGHY